MLCLALSGPGGGGSGPRGRVESSSACIFRCAMPMPQARPICVRLVEAHFVQSVWRTKRSTEKSRFRPSDGCRGPRGLGSLCEAARAAIRFGGQVSEDVLKCTIYSPGISPKKGTRGWPHFPLLSRCLSPPLSPFPPRFPPIAAQPKGPGCKLNFLALSVFGYY